MLWIIITAAVTAILSGYLGYKRLLQLYQLNTRNVVQSLFIAVLVFTLLMLLYQFSVMSEAIGATIITNVYSSLFGFFIGAAINQYNIKKKAGDIRYTHRSFLSDHAAIIMAIGVILFGIYRTAIFSDLAITPIRITSGLSFIAFGFWGMTLRLVPEFRKDGIILLDYKITWNDFLNYEWFLEDVIEIEYKQNDSIKHFKTSIPPEDQLIVEDLLRSKMMEKVSDNEKSGI